MNIIAIIIFILIYILNIIDYFETVYCIQAMGIKVEANRLARFLFKYHIAWIPKFLMFPILLIIMGYLVIAIDIYQIWAPIALLIFYFYVAIHNAKVIQKIRAYKKQIKEEK